MPDPLYYLYAFTWADCPLDSLGPGIDDRYPIELVGRGRLGAIASLVGLDRFDLKKLQPDGADVDWISRVAIRHNQIVDEAARIRPVLPLRMGTLFKSLAKIWIRLERHKDVINGFLEGLGDRLEWAAKIYSRAHDENKSPRNIMSNPAVDGGGVGVKYMLLRRKQAEISRAARSETKQQIAAVECALQSGANRFCRLKPLLAALTGRLEKMLWNAAFLVSPAALDIWRQTAELRASDLSENGLLLEVSGPWPAYHFCPEIAELQESENISGS